MNKKLIIILFLLIGLTNTACQSENESTNEAGIEGQSHSQREMSSNEIADHLVQLSTDVPDVEHATAIVIGPYALVAIDVNGDIDQSEVGSIKYQVVEALAHDPYGAQALVSADADILDRIDELRKEMDHGRPVQGIMNELAAIIGRIIPIMPGEEHRKGEDPTNTNDDKMSDQEQGELEEIQDKQSKGRMKEKEE